MTELDAEQLLRAANEIKQRDMDARDRDDIQHLMNSKQGRRVIWWMLEKGHVFGTTFSPVDPHISAFNEGQRSLALALLTRVMQHCPEQYLKMAAEANEQE